MTTPPRPTLAEDPRGGPAVPEGWSEVVADSDGLVLAGWTTDGVFHAYAPTERITRTLIEALATAHEVTP